jgi:acetylornithine deacetylase/succinyl-diaminopimelate desuccinylase-like protein
MKGVLMNNIEPNYERFTAAYEKKEKDLLKDYFNFLRIPSISSEIEHRQDMIDCAEWLKDYISHTGLEVEIWETGGHPTVFAEYNLAGKGKPTVLIYNHYDVQPVDPLDLWDSPPFEPTVRDGEVYARGAVDNKGQTFYVINALKTLLELDGKLPVNVKLLIDGEEESASPGLSGILNQRKKELTADHLMIVDGGMASLTEPSVNLGARGVISMRVEIIGSNVDLHSGVHGGVAYNPNHALVEILAGLRDSSGRITVPGFYDDIVELTSREKEQIDFSHNEEAYISMFGVKPAGGEKDYSPRESSTIRPTLEINGISGGYSGDGMKTVIPAKAAANLSSRLVPDQDPRKVGKLVSEFIEASAPEGVEVKVRVGKGGGKAVRVSPKARVIQAVVKAYEEVLQAKCGFLLMGATIPIAAALKEVSGADIVFMGLGLGLDNIHAPNEHFGLDRMKMGFTTIAQTIELLAE